MEFFARFRHLVSALQVLWKEWNLRSFILASFTLQLVLILIAPLRKKTSNVLILFSLWVSYLMADWIAIQAVGIVPRQLGNDAHEDLLTFWAQFLLVHLGGPDTITALALQDNDLWLRTALHLGVQVYAALGVLVKSIQHSILWVPTILMFLTGCIKYLERVVSLFYGQITKFDVNSTYQALGRRVHISKVHEEDLTNVMLVKDAFSLFLSYKELYVDKILDSFNSSEYFPDRRSEEAFRVLEIELNLVYESLYTKMIIIHNKLGKTLRPVTMALQVASLVIWCLTKKYGFHSCDIIITYTLLIGGIAVDVLAIFRIQLSYWNIAHLKNDFGFRSWFYNGLLSACWKRTWGRYRRKEEAPFWPWLRRVFFRHWSESVFQFNLINYYTHSKHFSRWERMLNRLGLENVLEKHTYVRKRWFSDDLRDIIFHGLDPRSSVNTDLRDVFSSSIIWSDWYKAYVKHKRLEDTFVKFRRIELFNVQFDESLVDWHFTTEAYYHLEITQMRAPGQLRIYKGEEEVTSCQKPYRYFCKVVSDYMLYLLRWQPDSMPPTVGASKERFDRNFKEVSEIVRKYPDLVLVRAVPDRRRPGMLGRARALQKILSSKLEKDEMWEFMAGVWILHLCYAAKHCKANFHAAQLKQGGELLSLVWLLMAHMGIGQKRLEVSSSEPELEPELESEPESQLESEPESGLESEPELEDGDGDGEIQVYRARTHA